jgi:hypothetical protein
VLLRPKGFREAYQTRTKGQQRLPGPIHDRKCFLMPKKKAATKAKTPQSESFSGLIPDRTPDVQLLAKTLRILVSDEVPDADERFQTARDELEISRAVGEVCWFQPPVERCNVYFLSWFRPRGVPG